MHYKLMPELPEVEAIRKRFKQLLKKPLLDIVVKNDALVFYNRSAQSIKGALKGRKLHSTARKGKYLFLDFGKDRCVIIHLGMSGDLKEFPAGEEPSYLKIAFSTDRKKYLGIKDGRRLGRIWIARDAKSDPRTSRLGPDVLTELPSVAVFCEMLKKRRLPIKTLLLDQSFLSGIGNYLADEILFRAAISPKRAASDLSPKEIKILRDSVVGIIRKAVQVDADSERYPKSWLFHYRWSRKNKALPNGIKLKFDTVGGRTTVWAPERQR